MQSASSNRKWILVRGKTTVRQNRETGSALFGNPFPHICDDFFLLYELSQKEGKQDKKTKKKEEKKQELFIMN